MKQTPWNLLTPDEKFERNETFHRKINEQIAEGKAKRKIQRKKEQRFRHRLTIKLTNHMLNCKACQEEGTPCKRAYSLGLFQHGMNKTFQKLPRILSGCRVDELHLQLVPEKKKLDLVQ